MKGTFGLFSSYLPPFRRGKPIPTGSLEAVRQSVERSRPTYGFSDGTDYQQLPNGIASRPSMGPPCRIFKTTSQITKFAGTTPGTGTGTIQVFNGATLIDTGQELSLFSTLSDKKIATGTYVQCKWIDNGWFIDTVASCADLTA